VFKGWGLGVIAEGTVPYTLSMIDSGRGAARAEDAQGTPTQSHMSPSILVYEDKLSAEVGNALALLHMGTSLIRNCLLLGPCSRTMPRALASPRGWAVSYERGTPAPPAAPVSGLGLMSEC